MRTVHARSLVVVVLLLSGLALAGCSDEPSASRTQRAPTDSAANVESSSTSSAPTSTTQVPLFEFASPDSATGWSVVNDTVMGGVSSGQLAVEDGVMFFSGELSLDNNGGFASVRSPAIDPQWVAAWSERSGPRLVVDGDGRTWAVEVRTDDVTGGWIASLPTSPDSVTDGTLPWSSFEAVTRFLDPREVDEPLDVRRIVSIAFYLVDGIEGPFRLGLVSIS
ncbi:MAG: CIA30 family protein [Actinomycetota bacterium]